MNELQVAEARPGFFLSRWRGLIPLDRLFWWDMIVVASGINIAAAAVALMLLGMKAPLMAALTVHFAPVPYNVFLFLAIWRTAGTVPGFLSSLAQIVAACWLMLATLI